MLKRGNLADKYLGEAITTSNDVRNMLPASGGTKTPHEIVYGTKPDVGTIRTFGCMAYAKWSEELCRKLDLKTVKCRYLGRSKNANGLYWLLICETGRVITARSECSMRTITVSKGWQTGRPMRQRRIYLGQTIKETKTQDQTVRKKKGPKDHHAQT
jgi:hypothetical protein